MRRIGKGRRALGLALALLLLLALLPGAAAAADIAASGACGNSLTWTLDGAGVLTITGSGPMWDFQASSAPWFDQREDICTVVLGPGVTTVGSYAFRLCSGLTKLLLPESLVSIGDYAFSYCEQLESVAIPAGVTAIGTEVFNECTRLRAITAAAGNLYFTDVDGVLFDKSGEVLLRYPEGKAGTAYTLPAGVRVIGCDAFWGCTKLTEIALPEGLQFIESWAFAWCGGLTEMIIPDGVAEIDTGAFSECDHLLSVTIPGSVTEVGGGAFDHCCALASVTLGEGVLSLGAYAFASCEDLTGIALPESLEVIGEYAFGWSGLTAVTIPENVTEIGGGAFFACIDLTEICVAANNPSYAAADGILYNRDMTRLLRCPGGIQGGVNVPAGVTAIENGAFAACDGLEDVTLPFGLGAIGGYAFSGSGLSAVNIPASVTSIGAGAFMESWIDYLRLPEGLEEIPEYLFWGCENLEALVIPYSVTSIAQGAFSTNRSLADVYYGGSAADWEAVVGIEELMVQGNVTVHYRSSGPDELVGSGTCGAGLSWTLSNLGCLTVFGTGRMDDYGLNGGPWCIAQEHIRYAVIAEGVTSVGDNAFRYCSALHEAEFPESLTRIGDQAFDGTDLQEVTIPAEVSSIGAGAFAECGTLTAIGVAADNPHFSAADGVLFNKSGTELLQCPAGKEGAFAIPAGVTAIGPWAFALCTGLTEITFPAGLASIGESAFMVCTGLTEAALPEGLTLIGAEAFRHCWNLTALSLPSSLTAIQNMAFYDCRLLTGVALPESLAVLGKQAFGNTAIASVALPSGLTTVANGAFYTWNSLQEITVAADNPSFSSADGVLFNKSGTRLVAYPGGKTGDYAVPAGVAAIGSYAFAGCGGLSAVALPRGLTDVESYAFFRCRSLEEIVVPAELTNVGISAFDECSSLYRVLYAGSREQWDLITVLRGNEPLRQVGEITFDYGALPLILTVVPSDYTGPEGSRATFTVEAEGEAPFTYQWYVKNRTARKFSKSSITAATYSVTLTEANDGRQLYCVVTDAYGNTAQTDTVTMTVAQPLTIVAQPTNYSGPAGSTAAFTVAAAGEGLSYQWYVKNRTARKFSKSSITAATYSVTLTETNAGRQLYCMVTDAYGNTVQTDTVTMTVAQPLTIVTQPVDYYGPAGSTATFTVEAAGDGLSYQWYVKKPSASKFSKSSITTATYSVELTAARNGNRLYCVVTDAYGNTERTDTVTMSISAPALTILRQPTDYAGPAGSMATFSVVADGEELSYQWYVKKPSASKFSKSSITTATYSVELTAARNGNRLYCVVTDAYGNTVQTDTVTMTIEEEALAVPELTGATAGTNGITVTWNAVDGTTTYRVYRKTGSGNWISLGDLTGLSYTDAAVLSGTAYTYTVKASNGAEWSGFDEIGVTATA